MFSSVGWFVCRARIALARYTQRLRYTWVCDWRRLVCSGPALSHVIRRRLFRYFGKPLVPAPVLRIVVRIGHGGHLPARPFHGRARRQPPLSRGGSSVRCSCRAFVFGLELGSFAPACSARRRSIIRL